MRERQLLAGDYHWQARLGQLILRAMQLAEAVWVVMQFKTPLLEQ